MLLVRLYPHKETKHLLLPHCARDGRRARGARWTAPWCSLLEEPAAPADTHSGEGPVLQCTHLTAVHPLWSLVSRPFAAEV